MNMFKQAANPKHPFKRFNRLYPVALLIAAFLFSQCAADPETVEDAPDPVSGLAATVGNGQVELSWTNPGTEFDKVTVFYKQGAAVSGTDDANATEANAGTAESYLFTGLTNGETYHFAVYTYKEAGGFSSGKTVTAVPLSAVSGFSVPDTGQTQSFTATFGEDHDYVDIPNARSYTDNGDKTVTDNATGLMWEQLPAAGDHTADNWADAVTECENRSTANYTDWRLPTVLELNYLTHYGISDKAIDTNYFPNTKQDYYRSSTAVANNTGNAFDVGFSLGDGTILSHAKTDNGYVRCVRGDQISSGVNLTDNGDGTVTDADTGLVWQQLEAAHTATTWEAALSYCESLNHAGQSDWRLPNINELKSIVDYSAYDPAVDGTYFPNTKSNYYWSSTTYSYGTGFAWVIASGTGSTTSFNKTNTYYVRCVRGG